MNNRKRVIYIGLLLIITVIVSITTFSYAFLTRVDEQKGKLNMVVGKLDYKIESQDLTNNSITIAPNSIKKITIKLTSLNGIDSKYELFYETTNNDVEVGYTGSITPTGTITASGVKEVEVILSNISNTSATVTFSCEGGFTYNTLVKSKGISIPSQTSICANYTTHVWNYDYAGDSQEFIAPCDGTYTMETWGASGGISSSYPTNDVGQGKGAYTKGNTALTTGDNIYIYTGERGTSISFANLTREYNFNGGGYANVRPSDTVGTNLSSGGGATDIRTVAENWNDADSLRSRVMVAAGGAGGSYDGSEPGAGGGLTGYDGIKATGNWWRTLEAGYGANQTEPGPLSGESFLVIGGFGYGGTSSGGGSGGGAGGSGWYGGSGGYVQSGGGGSSYISGHTGCVGVTSQSSSNPKTDCTTGTTDQDCSISPYGITFTDTMMIDGAGYRWGNEKKYYMGQPQPDGTVADGHIGNGYARITYYGTDAKTITLDYNIPKEYSTHSIVNTTETNFTGINSDSRFADVFYTDDIFPNDIMRFTYTIDYTNLTTNNSSSTRIKFQAAGHINGWKGNTQLAKSKYGVVGTGSCSDVYDVVFTASHIAEGYYHTSFRIDYYDGGSMTLTDFKIQRIHKEDYKKIVGSTMDYMPTPSEDGYTFVGWFTDPVGGTQVTSSTSVPNTDTTYYAHWTYNVENNEGD